jgi:5-methylcytosine-specific restriction endonuclease McrA
MSKPRVTKGIRALHVHERRRLRRDLLIKYGPYCQLCLIWGKTQDFARIDLLSARQPKSLSLDHIIPVSQGGTNEEDNIWPTHIRCNESREDKPLTVRVEVDFNIKSRTTASSGRIAYTSSSLKY